MFCRLLAFPVKHTELCGLIDMQICISMFEKKTAALACFCFIEKNKLAGSLRTKWLRSCLDVCNVFISKSDICTSGIWWMGWKQYSFVVMV